MISEIDRSIEERAQVRGLCVAVCASLHLLMLCFVHSTYPAVTCQVTRVMALRYNPLVCPCMCPCFCNVSCCVSSCVQPPSQANATGQAAETALTGCEGIAAGGRGVQAGEQNSAEASEGTLMCITQNRISAAGLLCKVSMAASFICLL